jgi:1-acyl-sn-glycerol-3-phosphate acyltransferase
LSVAEKGDWREKKKWYTYEMWLVRVVRYTLRRLAELTTTVTCEGLENVPATGPCIIASNHLSLWDVLMMGIYLPRHPFFMAKRELYRIPVLSYLIRLAGTFPVNRGERDMWALKQAERVLAAGQMLYIFPEGTRRGRTGQLGRGKVGAVLFALRYQVPLVPAAIWGTQHIRPGFRNMNKISLRVAPPLDVAAIAGPPPHDRAVLRDLTVALMEQISAMLPPEAHSEPAARSSE